VGEGAFRNDTSRVPSPHFGGEGVGEGDFVTYGGPIRQKTRFEVPDMLTSILDS